MNLFDYARAATLADAVASGRAEGAAFLAGGTNLLDLMKANLVRPARLVDITRLPGLDRIEPLADGGVRIGALVRNSALAHDAMFARTFPAVAEALLSGASPQLRNAATVAGNVMQRTRCPYFYDAASACNKREPGAGCDARGGHTRLQAVLGWSEHCIATHPSDFCVPLVAFDAVAEIDGPRGRREVPLEEREVSLEERHKPLEDCCKALKEPQVVLLEERHKPLEESSDLRRMPLEGRHKPQEVPQEEPQEE